MSSVQLNRQVVFLMVGYPGAGKSYFAHQFAETIGGIHISDNRIRYELYEDPQYDESENFVVDRMTTYMLDEFLDAGKSIVYDVRYNKKSQRKKFREHFRRSPVPVITVWVQTDLESAFDRASNRDRRQTDDKFVPAMTFEVFDKLQKQFQAPGRDEIPVVISGKHLFRTQNAAVVRRLKDKAYIETSQLSDPGAPQVGGRVDYDRRRITLR